MTRNSDNVRNRTLVWGEFCHATPSVSCRFCVSATGTEGGRGHRAYDLCFWSSRGQHIALDGRSCAQSSPVVARLRRAFEAREHTFITGCCERGAEQVLRAIGASNRASGTELKAAYRDVMKVWLMDRWSNCIVPLSLVERCHADIGSSKDKSEDDRQ